MVRAESLGQQNNQWLTGQASALVAKHALATRIDETDTLAAIDDDERVLSAIDHGSERLGGGPERFVVAHGSRTAGQIETGPPPRNTCCWPARARRADLNARLVVHGIEEVVIVLRRFQLVEQELHRIGRSHRR